MATKMNGKKGLPLYSSTVSKTSAKQQQKQQKSKKVEVRWLQSEAELYLKQWQRRYHQLEGIDDNYHQLSHHILSNNQLEQYDDWCLTAQRILDLDLELIDNKNNIIINNSNNIEIITNKLVNNNLNNNSNFDLFWRREQSKLIFNFDDNSKSNSSAVEEEDPLEDEDDDRLVDLEAVENMCCTHNRDIDSNRLTAFKSLVNHKTDVSKESEELFALNLNKKLDLLSSSTSSLPPASKSRQSKTRARESQGGSRAPRPRPPPVRRQVFKCEHPGCSYQSDRNFNFLRHKRTHRKIKSDIIDIHINGEHLAKSKSIINCTSILSDHNMSDNEDCDESASSHPNSNSINNSSDNNSANNDSFLF